MLSTAKVYYKEKFKPTAIRALHRLLWTACKISIPLSIVQSFLGQYPRKDQCTHSINTISKLQKGLALQGFFVD